MQCRRSGPQAVVSRRLLICRGCVRSCSSIVLGQHSTVSRRRSWKRSSGKPGMTTRHQVPPWASWIENAASCRSAQRTHREWQPAKNTSNTLPSAYASCASHEDLTVPSCLLLRRLRASVRVFMDGYRFDTQEELQRAERQLDQERLRAPTAAPAQLGGHEAAWESALQDAQQKLQQALTEKTVSCCTRHTRNASSSGETWRALVLTCLGHYDNR